MILGVVRLDFEGGASKIFLRLNSVERDEKSAVFATPKTLKSDKNAISAC